MGNVDYYYDEKTHTLACLLETNIIRFEDRNKWIDDVECFVVFQDVLRDRIHVMELSDFEDTFLCFKLNDIHMIQEWYGINDVAFAKLKKIIKEILEAEI